ncbi:MAG TPA: polyprenyl synthetase family protein [Helicobacteraceae bacterium]|nr:polyprenyl synthetase family protein [Helicobacteraceae bacterium]
MSLDVVEKQMMSFVQECEDDDVIAYFNALQGGKRMRAKLMLHIASSSEQAIMLAAIVEMIHAASLLHDDVIDDAQLRRGVPSVNATQGSKIAVMLGDILYSKAFEKLTQFPDAIAKSIASAVSKLSLGELQDVTMAQQFTTDKAAYMQMLYLKTASLIEATAYSAALLAGKTEDEAQQYAQYGKFLGLSFQLVDDILDVIADATTLGKPAMNDFVEGKTTLPYIFLYESLDANARKKLQSMHQRELLQEEVRWIQQSMSDNHIIEKAKEHAKEISAKALTCTTDNYLQTILTQQLERHY